MVPNGWRLTSLGEVCSNKLQTGPFGSQLHAHEYTDTGVAVLMPKDLIGFKANLKTAAKIPASRTKDLAKHILKKGDILFSRRGDVARFAVIDESSEGALCGTGCLKATVNEEHSPIFLSYFLQKNAVRKWLEQNAVGQTMPNMNTAILRELPLMVASSKGEEVKIAKILGTWDKAISTTERLIDNSKQQKKALMQQLLTGKKRLLDDSGKPFEGNWEEVSLEQVAKYRRGSFPQPYGNPEWEDKINGYPFVQVYDIDKNMKLKTSTKFKISDAAIGKSVFIPKETIIVSLQGTIGRVAITQYDAYVDRTVLLFQEFLVPMNKVFFAYVIQELFEIEKTKAPGGTIKTITKDVLSNFKILIPSLEEQQKIAAVLTNADKEIELLDKQLDDLKQEKKALMQQLLTGKRRVKSGDKEVA